MLAGKDEAFIKESIIDPNKEIADGYQSGIMPAELRQTRSRRPSSTRS